MSSIRVVLDTNSLVSALLGSGNLTYILDAWLENKFILITSNYLCNELRQVTARDKLRKYISEEKTEKLIRFIITKAVIVNSPKQITVCRDPKDNMVLECAVGGKADYLVTGDRDLLVLNPFEGIRIITPAEFLKLIPEWEQTRR